MVEKTVSQREREREKDDQENMMSIRLGSCVGQKVTFGYQIVEKIRT
jgi:hypothetical protein